MAAPGKKYLLIKVPDHQPSTTGGTGSTPDYSTFIRLGTPDANPPMKEVLDEILADGFIDDTRDRGTNHVARGTAEGLGGAGGPGHALTVAERQSETAKFLTKGGWHDHTEGNRLSTTQGDKIEVIRGNLKQVVLGRQDALDNASTRDESGGHLQEGNLAPGSISEIKWVKDSYTGTWRVTELTEKGDLHEIFHGSVKEEFYGESIESIIGSESQGTLPETQLSQYTTKQTRPTITEKTWAANISSYTGSDGNTVDKVYEETWANTIESRVYGKAEILDYKGKVGAGVAHILEETHAVNNESRLFAAADSELKITMASTGLLLTGVHTDIEVAALRLEVKAGGAFFELEAGLLYVELFMGNKVEMFMGSKMEVDDTKFDTALNAYKATLKQGETVGDFKILALKFGASTFKGSIGIGD